MSSIEKRPTLTNEEERPESEVTVNYENPDAKVLSDPKFHYHGVFDPEIAGLRKFYFTTIAKGIVLVIIAIWCILPFYWATLWRTPEYAHNLKCLIINYDDGPVGTYFANFFDKINGQIYGFPSWVVTPASDYPGGPSEVADKLVDHAAWLAIVINEGASEALTTATTNADASYDPSTAITAFVVEARNENAYLEVIYPALVEVLNYGIGNFSLSYAKNNLSATTNIATILSQAPQIAIAPVYYQLNNLRPFDIPVAEAVDFVGLIYLLIFSFIIAMLHFGARAPLAPRLKLSSLIKLRLFAPLVLYFIPSWMYAMVSLAFGVDFNRKFGHSGFVIYWAAVYLGMLALGMAIESMITLLTPRFIPFFLILWIITNVSVSFEPIELMNVFYHYGYATPFYNISNIVRTILFSTKNQLGLNFGVLFCWIFVSVICLPLIQWFVRWGEVKEMRKKNEQNGKVA